MNILYLVGAILWIIPIPFGMIMLFKWLKEARDNGELDTEIIVHTICISLCICIPIVGYWAVYKIFEQEEQFNNETQV